MGFLDFFKKHQQENDAKLVAAIEHFSHHVSHAIRAGFADVARAIDHQQRKAVSATLVLVNSKGDPIMQTVNINDAPGSALYQEFSGLNGSGSVVPPTGSVQYASDTPAVATVDPNTGQLAYISAGTATISASDGGNLPASFVLIVTPATAPPPPPPVAQSSTLTFVPPASAGSSASGAARANAASSSRPAHS